tara:strand:+ start:4588 stop:5247 length:660 start_codon:yes stop_codon:yes gene_type:complete
MKYRTILTRNGEYIKTLHRCKKRKTAFINFNRIRDNNTALFERRFVNNNGIVPAKYKIYVVKNTENEDEFRTVRNSVGKFVEETPLYDIWTILNDAVYLIEESFWVYGHNPHTDRKTIKDIIHLLLIKAKVKDYNKQTVVVHNKLLIYNEEQFDMVICKCKEDAQRLHHKLSDACVANKINSIYFMGTAKDKMISDYYDVIHENTNWPYTKIRRTTTRP